MRQSPLLIVYKGISLIRNVIFFYLFLFVVKKDSTHSVIELGRDSFWVLASWSALYIVMSWYTTTFSLDAHHLTKRSGVLFRKTQQIPVRQLEQATVKRHWFHHLTNTVGYTYQLTDAEEQLKIEMINASKMQLMQGQKAEQAVLFQPTRKQLVKASFTSLRFLMAIPFLVAFYSRVDHFIKLEPYTAIFIEKVKTDTVWLIGTIAGYIVVSIACALIFTFIKFGKDRVCKEGDLLVIEKGLWNQSKVTLHTVKISGVEIRQTFLKRLLGLAEIRLQFKSNDENELQSIYPYFEYEQAVAFVNTHFPQFTVKGEAQHLSRSALIPRLLRGMGLIAVLSIGCYLLQDWLPVAYYWVCLGLACIVLLGVYLAYCQFRLTMDDERMQLKTGIFGSKVTVVHLQNIVGVEVGTSMLQRLLGLQSMTVRTYTERLEEYALKDLQQGALSTIVRLGSKRLRGSQ